MRSYTYLNDHFAVCGIDYGEEGQEKPGDLL